MFVMSDSVEFIPHQFIHAEMKIHNESYRVIFLNS